MSEENEQNKNLPGNGRILFYYFVVVLMLCFVAAGILICAFDTAFVEKEKWLKVAEEQKKAEPFDPAGTGKHLFR